MTGTKPASFPSEVPALSRRYGFKLLATVVAALAGIAADMAASRGLGPADYGKFYFLQQFFFVIFSFLSTSTSMAFVTRAARRPRAKGFTFIYVLSLALMPLLLQFFASAAFLFGFGGVVWPGISAPFVYLGGFAAYLTFLGREGTSIGDAHGLTVPLEKIRVAQRVLALLSIGGLFVAGFVNLYSFLFYTCAVNGVLVIALFTALMRRGLLRTPRRLFRPRFLGTALRYFYEYSSPLLTLSLASMGSALFDRWLLQRVSGNVDQGYFSLAYQISQVMLLLIAAFIPLLMRELSILHGASDRARMTSMFERVTKNLFFLAAAGACFAAVFCDKVSALVGGHLFLASATPVALVVLCTMYRAYGQVTSTLLYATGETRTYRNVSICVAVAGICLTYLLVGPRQFFGLQLGALGLAWKVFAIELISGNVLAFFCCRYLGSHYRGLLFQQVTCVVSLLGLAFVSRLIMTSVMPADTGFLMTGALVASASLIYMTMVGFLVWRYPPISGLSREKLAALANSVIRVVRPSPG